MRWMTLMILAMAFWVLPGCPAVIETDSTPDTVVIDNSQPPDNNTTIIEHDDAPAPDTKVEVDVDTDSTK